MHAAMLVKFSFSRRPGLYASYLIPLLNEQGAKKKQLNLNESVLSTSLQTLPKRAVLPT